MSSIQSVKLAIGYQSAAQRPACTSCKHSTMGTAHPPRFNCTRYGFSTTAMSICREYDRPGTTGVTPP